MSYTLIYNQEQYNFKDNSTNKYIFNDWFDYAVSINDYFYVSRNNRCNFLNNKLQFVFDEWLIGIAPLEYNLIKIQRNDKKYNIFNNGILLLNNWVDKISYFYNLGHEINYAYIWNNNMEYRIDIEGNLMYYLE